MNKLHLIILMVIAAAMLAIQGCTTHAETMNEEKKTAETKIEVTHPAKGSVGSSIAIPGELIAFQHVDLYAKISSFVKNIYVDAGREVKAGQLLAVMEAPEVNSQLSAAQSRLKSQEAIYLASKATYDRLLQTSQTPGTVSQNDLDIAYARQKSDLAQLEAAKATYQEVSHTNNYLEIRAPFDGTITAKNVSVGAYVGPTGKGSDQPIFTLQEQKKLRLVVSVPDAYAGYIDNNTEVSFGVKSQPDQFRGKISRMAGALDNKLRSQRVEIDVENATKVLLPGMIAQVKIPLKGSVRAYTLPTSAILTSTEGVFVIRINNNKAEWVPVKTGNSDAQNTEVIGELSETDVVIKNASEEYHKGDKVGNIGLANN